MQHTHVNCGFKRMLASQVLMSGDNAALSYFQIIFCLGNLVSQFALKRSRPLKLQPPSVMAGIGVAE